MRKFFSHLHVTGETQGETCATIYARFMWNERSGELADAKRLTRSRYYVGLGIDDSHFDDVTKRSVMISDTLLLSHATSQTFHFVGSYGYSDNSVRNSTIYDGDGPGATAMHGHPGASFPLRKADDIPATHSRETSYGFHCPDLESLGQWLISAKPLLKSGLAWYLPNYSTRTQSLNIRESEIHYGNPRHVEAVDYLLRDGRAVEMSGVEPTTGDHVREILRIDLPFLEGVSLRDFSDITLNEFASYSSFRNFLRSQFIELDLSMNDVQSQRAVHKISLQIADEIHSMESQIRKVKRTRAVSVAGGALGTVTASLVAVYGPSLGQAVTALGLGGAGGIWGIISSIAQNETRRVDKWYYVWALSRRAHIL
ncbi:hypothetical protein ACIP5U_34400 [Streptomyces sp. NPDC088788]|uniref:hypothetical protein n=1 Tax=Streptomyces sp. NPDC088788 TaxID=3365898 RepID=UPI0037FA1F24